MTCPNCQTENAEGAKYCSQCGADLTPAATGKGKWLTPDTFLLTFIGVSITGNVLLLILHLIGTTFSLTFSAPVIIITTLTHLCICFSYILIPLAIKKASLRVIGLISTGILILYFIISNIISMVSMLNVRY